MAAATAMTTFSRPTQPLGRVEESGFIAKLSRPSFEAVAKASTRMNFENGE